MQRRRITTDGLTQEVLEDGEGPLVLLCHGFPELAWSWRNQVPALAAAGFHAVAPDMRGYGGTDAPGERDAYTILHLVGDMVDLVRALGETRAVVVGHDWGAPVAWHCALLRPDIFRAVAGLSVPFQPRRAGKPPLQTWRELLSRKGLGEFYISQFQDPATAEEFDADPAAALRRAFWSYDGSTPAAERGTGFVPAGQTFLSQVRGDARLPPWLSESEFSAYVDAFSAKGFFGPIAWYQNVDRNWALTAFAQDRTIDAPGLFLVGEHDPVRNYMGHAEKELKLWVPGLKDQRVLPGAGHWLQQERPGEVNAALIEFLQSL